MALTVACAHGAGLGALGRVLERLSSSVDVLEQKEPNSLYSTPATHSSTGTPTSTSKTVTRLLRSAVFWLLRAVCALLFSCPTQDMSMPLSITVCVCQLVHSQYPPFSDRNSQ